jgi:hypothetical protein
MKSDVVRGVLIKDYLVFPFSGDYPRLLKSRIPMLRIKKDGIKVAKQLLARKGYRLVTREWSHIEARLRDSIAIKVDAQVKGSRFLVQDEEESTVRDRVEAVRTEMARFSHRCEYHLERKGISAKGKVLKDKPNAVKGIWVALITTKFDPELEYIDATFASITSPLIESTLVLGSRKLIMSSLPPIHHSKAPYLHVRLSSLDPDGTETETLASFEGLLTSELKDDIRSFALHLLNKF